MVNLGVDSLLVGVWVLGVLSLGLGKRGKRNDLKIKKEAVMKREKEKDQ